jgi:hypothetical protein
MDALLKTSKSVKPDTEIRKEHFLGFVSSRQQTALNTCHTDNIEMYPHVYVHWRISWPIG